MKKLLILLLLALVLVACDSPKIHENVDEGVANDSIQLMEMILKNADDGISIEDVNEDDEKLFISYKKKYIDEDVTIPLNLNKAEEDIVLMASASLVAFANGLSLESDKDRVKENNEYMIEFIESGKGAGE